MPVLMVTNFFRCSHAAQPSGWLLAPLLLGQQLHLIDGVFATQTAEVCVLFAVTNAAVNDLSPHRVVI